MTISAYTIASIPVVSDGGENSNDSNKRQPIYKTHKKVPVMRSDERRHSEDLLASAMGQRQSAQRLPRKAPTALFLEDSVEKGRLENSSTEPGSPNPDVRNRDKSDAHDAQIPVLISTAQQPMAQSQPDLSSLPSKLAAIESSLIGGEGRVSRIQIQDYLEDVSRQLNSPGELRKFSNLLTAGQRDELMFNLEFIDGYFEASVVDGDSNKKIAQALQNMMIQIGRDNLNAFSSSPVAQLAESLSVARNVVSEKSAAISAQDRRRLLDVEAGGFSDSPAEEELVVSSNANKKMSLERPEIKTGRGAKQQMQTYDSEKENDKKRDDTLPLVTLRSV